MAVDAGKDFADRVDSDILLELLIEAGERLDKADIPLMGRFYWDFEAQEIRGN
jgi:hypothetical protein